MSDVRTKQEEIDRNLDFFLERLPTLISTQRGRYALIRDREISGFYDTIRDAQTSGAHLYADGLFSIQQVTEFVGDLGLFSHAVHMGPA